MRRIMLICGSREEFAKTTVRQILSDQVGREDSALPESAKRACRHDRDARNRKKRNREPNLRRIHPFHAWFREATTRGRSTEATNSVDRFGRTISGPVKRAFVPFLNRLSPADLLDTALEVQAFR